MFTLQLTESEIVQVIYAKYSHHQRIAQRRIEVLLLVYHRLAHQQVVAISDVHRDTVINYIKTYQ